MISNFSSQSKIIGLVLMGISGLRDCTFRARCKSYIVRWYLFICILLCPIDVDKFWTAVMHALKWSLWQVWILFRFLLADNVNRSSTCTYWIIESRQGLWIYILGFKLLLDLCFWRYCSCRLIMYNSTRLTETNIYLCISASMFCTSKISGRLLYSECRHYLIIFCVFIRLR